MTITTATFAALPASSTSSPQPASDAHRVELTSSSHLAIDDSNSNSGQHASYAATNASSSPSAVLDFLARFSIAPPSMAIVAPAMLSGATQAVIFNPIDRALYLRVIMRRSLFHVDNWAKPFQGFANAGLHRMLSAGGYLCWQEVTKRAITGKLENDLAERFLVGLAAGSIMGFSLNGLQLVKYRLWTEGSGSFLAVTHQLYSANGMGIFARGTKVSIMRDAAFGLTYEVLRGTRRTEDVANNSPTANFVRDTAAASVACWVSAPINYCRNIVYGVPPQSCPLGVYALLHNLYCESMRGGNTFVQRWNIMNSRLNLGWAALRVGVGVAVSQSLFEFYKRQYASFVG